MAVAIALIITFAYVHFSGGRLAFGTNPFPTAAKRRERETVMIEGQMAVLSINARDGIMEVCMGWNIMVAYSVS